MSETQKRFRYEQKEGTEPVKCLGITFENDEARRAYFLERLKEKLKDPEFRKIEGFPTGSDEDILALSDPPYYTACPNPFFAEMIERSSTLNTSFGQHNTKPFAADITEGKTDPLYLAHSYHTKVPPHALVKYLLWYTKPGDSVLDAYCGSGMTGVAAHLCADPSPTFRARIESDLTQMGAETVPWGHRQVLLNDLSPAATFISANYCLPQNTSHVEEEIRSALRVIKSEFQWFYETAHNGWRAGERYIQHWNNRYDQTGKGNVILTIWSEVVTCPQCAGEVNLWKHALDRDAASILNEFACPNCGAISKKDAFERRAETIWDDFLKIQVTRNKFVPAFCIYDWEGKRYEKIPDDADLHTLAQIEKLPATPGSPVCLMMDSPDAWGNMYRTGYHRGVSHVHHFFTKRNWTLLSALWARASSPGARFVLTSLMNRLSRMSSLHMKNFFRGGGGFAAGNTKGNLYLPSFFVEQSPFAYLEERLSKALAGLRSRPSGTTIAISTGSADRLTIPSNSVDYIFIDPPFGENLIYSELNFLWEAWLRVKTNNQPEAIIDTYRDKDLHSYQQMMKSGFDELYRVLKPGKWMTVEFHNSQNAVWSAIQEALQASGFVIADVRILDKKQGSHKQNVAGGAVKKDLVISAYKPNDGLEERFKLQAGTTEGVWVFVRTHVKQLPVFVDKQGQAEMIIERQNYLLYDRMVAFHVQRSVLVPLTAAEFYEGLSQRFAERDGMYFLSEQVAEYDRKRMTVKELLQLTLFVTDETSAIQWLRQQLVHRPQTFQELHPQFLKEVGGWQKHEKPLELSELLEQNFLRYDGKPEVPSQIHSYLSTNFKDLRNLPNDNPTLKTKARDRWYVPDVKKAADLEKLRERTLLREFEDYRQSKQKRIKVFRIEAMRAGFKKAWQDRDYRTIIEVANKIPEIVLQEDAKLLMWYDQALTRAGDSS